MQKITKELVLHCVEWLCTHDCKSKLKLVFEMGNCLF